MKKRRKSIKRMPKNIEPCWSIIPVSDTSIITDYPHIALKGFNILNILQTNEIKAKIREANKPGGSSHDIQECLRRPLIEIGFEPEREGLFRDKPTAPNWRPDFYAEVGGSGIMVEVEKYGAESSKGDIGNFTRCLICDRTEFLFLLVPQFLKKKRQSPKKLFDKVVNNIKIIASKNNGEHIKAVFVFGY